MKRFVLVLSIPVLLASPLAWAQEMPSDPRLIAMKLEEANFLLDQRRQQLEQANATILTLNQEKNRTAEYWTAYVNGLKPEAAMNPAKDAAPPVPAPKPEPAKKS